MLKLAFFLLLLHLVTYIPTADAGAAPIVDWTELSRTCQADWTKYQAKLKRLRPKAKKWHDSVSEDVLRDMIDERNPLIILVLATWPEDLAQNYPYWRSKQDCAQLHSGFMDTAMSASKSTAARLQSLQLWQDCAVTLYADREEETLPSPLFSLYQCYIKQATRPQTD